VPAATRGIIHGGTRVGDGAKVAILELVGYEFKKKEKKEKSKGRRSRRSQKLNPPPQRLQRPAPGNRGGLFFCPPAP